MLGGVGVLLVNFDESSLTKSLGARIDDDITFAAKLGAGFEFYITNQAAVFVECAYMFSNPKTTVTGPGGSVDVEGSNNMGFLGGGLKLNF